jgi:hypothetical protein
MAEQTTIVPMERIVTTGYFTDELVERGER